jgi:hypothetical protein
MNFLCNENWKLNFFLDRKLSKRRIFKSFKTVFGRFSVRISAETLANLSKVFRGFLQPFQANSGNVPPLSHDLSLPDPIQYNIHQSYPPMVYWLCREICLKELSSSVSYRVLIVFSFLEIRGFCVATNMFSYLFACFFIRLLTDSSSTFVSSFDICSQPKIDNLLCLALQSEILPNQLTN